MVHAYDDVYNCTLNSVSWVPTDSSTIELAVYANDTSGYSSNATIILYIDNTDPTITEINIEGKPIYKDSDTLTITTNGKDSVFGNDGIQHCRVYRSADQVFGGDTYLANLGSDCNGTADLDLTTLTANTYYILVRPVDHLNHSAYHYFNISIDNTEPVLSNFQSNDTDNYSNSIQVLSFNVTASDDDGVTGGVVGVNISADSFVTVLEMNLTGNNNYEINATLSELGCNLNGACTIEVRAYDNASNFAAASYVHHLDDISPSIEAFSANDTYIQNDTFIYVNISMNNGENSSNLTYLKIEGQDMTWNSSTQIWELIFQVDNDGVFEITALDKADNYYSNNTFTYSLDDIAPAVYAAGIGPTALSYDNLINSLNNYTFYFNTTDQKNGGGTGTYTTIEIYGFSPASDSELSYNGSEKYTVYTRPSDLGFDNTYNSYQNFTVYVEDAAGNSNSTNITVLLDNTKGHISNLTTSDPDNATNGTTEISFRVRALDVGENASGTQYVTISGDGFGITESMSHVGSNIYEYNGTLTDIGCTSDALCTVEAKLFDNSGNTNTTTHYHMRDDTPPTVTEFNSNETYITSSRTVYINISLGGESDSNITFLTVEGTALEWNAQTSMWEQNVTVDNDGIFNIVVMDIANNTFRNDSILYVIDNIAPTVYNVNTSDAENIVNSRTNYTITFETNDTIDSGTSGNISSIIIWGHNITYNHSFDYNSSNSYSVKKNMTYFGYDSSTDSYKNLTIRVIDFAGNIVTYNLSLLIDNTPPSIIGRYYYNPTYPSVFAHTPSLLGAPLTSVYFTTTAIRNITWEVNATDNFALSNVKNVTMSHNDTSTKYTMIYSGSQTVYNILNKTTPEIGMNAETYNITAEMWDKAENYNSTSFKIRVMDTQPNFVFINVSPNPAQVSSYRYTPTNISVNITSDSGLSTNDNEALTINITLPNSSIVVMNFNRSNFTITTQGSYDVNYLEFEYAPPIEGYYDLYFIAQNTLDLTSDAEANFTAIGTSQINVTIAPITPPALSLAGITTDNNVTSKINVSIQNIGDVNMYNLTVAATGISGATNSVGDDPVNLADTILPSEFYSTLSSPYSVNVTFSYLAEIGSKKVYLIVSWTNPDSTRDSDTKIIDFSISQNPALRITEDTITDSLVYVNENKQIASIDVESYGNIAFSLLEFHNTSGSLPMSDINFTPTNITNLNKAEDIDVNVSILATSRGPQNATIVLNASSQTCSPASNCEDSFLINITAWDRINVSVYEPTTYQFNKTLLNVSCNVYSDVNLANISSYPVNLTIDGVTSVIRNTESSGNITVTIDTATLTPGNYPVSCNISNKTSAYYIVNSDRDNINLSVYGNLTLNVNRTVNNGSIYWYNSLTPYTTTFSATILDGDAQPVNVTNVTFYSNRTASNTFGVIGSCLTNESGECDFVWDPTVESGGNYTVFYNASKDYYYNSNNGNEDVEILAGMRISITNPAENSYVSRNSSIDLNVTLVQANGQIANGLIKTLDYYIDDIHLVNISYSNSYLWYINISNSSYARGLHNLTAIVNTTSDTILRDFITFNLSDTAKILSLNILNDTILRAGGSAKLTGILELDNYDSQRENHTCYWYDEFNSTSSLINSSKTNSTGHCVLDFKGNNTYLVGPHKIYLNITQNLSDNILATAPQLLNISLNLTEELNVTLHSPNSSLYHRGDTLLLNATTKDMYYNITSSTNFVWNISNGTYTTQISQHSNGTYVIPSNFSLGESNISVLSTRTYYNSHEQKINITVFGYSNVEYYAPADPSQDRDELIDLICRVIDANNSNSTTSGVQSYPVYFYLNNQTDTMISGINLTNSTGYAHYLLNMSNTSRFALGTYTTQCIIYDNSTLMYTASTNETEQILHLIDSLDVTMDIQGDIIYRDDEFIDSSTASTIILNVTDDSFPVNGANVTLNIGHLTILGTTNGTGNFLYTWNPNSSFIAGEYNITVNITKLHYANRSVSGSVVLRSFIKPSWVLPNNDQVVNVSNDDSVYLRCDVLESNSSVNAENYSFSVEMSSFSPAYFKTLQVLNTTLSIQNNIGDTIYQNYTWTETGANGNYNYSANVLSINTTLSHNLTNDQTDLNLTGYHSLIINTTQKSDNARYDVLLYNTSSSIYYKIIDNSSTNETVVNITGKIIDGLRLVIYTNDSNPANISINTISFEENIYTDSIEVSNTVMFNGDDFYSKNHGDMENILVDDSDMWNVSADLTASKSSLRRTQGNYSLKAEFINITEGASQYVSFDYSGLLSIDSLYKRLTFWIYSNSSNLVFNITVNNGTSEGTVNLGNFSGWKYFQPSFENFSIGMSKISSFNINFYNNNSVNLSSFIHVDDIRLMANLTTDNDGEALVVWYPKALGPYKMQCRVKNESYYNYTLRDTLNVFTLAERSLNDTAISLFTNVSEANITTGNVYSFSVTNQSYRDYIMPWNFTGLIEELEVFSMVNEDITLNLSLLSDTMSFNETYMLNKSSIELSALSHSTFKIYFNATNISQDYANQTSVLRIENEASDEILFIYFNLTSVVININLVSPDQNNILHRVNESDTLNFIVNITVNGSSEENSTTNIIKSVKISNSTCKISSAIYENSLWNLTCPAPFPDGNTINNSVIVSANIQGLTILGKTGIGNAHITEQDIIEYTDVTGPIIHWANVSVVNISLDRNISSHITDNLDVNNTVLRLFSPGAGNTITSFDNYTEPFNLRFNSTSNKTTINVTIPYNSTTYESSMTIRVNQSYLVNPYLKIGGRTAWKYTGTYGIASQFNDTSTQLQINASTLKYITIPGEATVTSVKINITGIPENHSLAYPTGITQDSNGYLFVSDTNNHLIHIFDSSDNYLTSIGSNLGSSNTQFAYPEMLHIDQNDKLYIADKTNKRIQIYSAFNSSVVTSTFGAGLVNTGTIENFTSISTYPIMNSTGWYYSNATIAQSSDDKVEGTYSLSYLTSTSPVARVTWYNTKIDISQYTNILLHHKANHTFNYTIRLSDKNNCSYDYPQTSSATWEQENIHLDLFASNGCILFSVSKLEFIFTNTTSVTGYFDNITLYRPYTKNSHIKTISESNIAFSNPRSVHTDNQSNIFIVDSGRNLIYKFNSDYSYNTSIGLYGGEYNFSIPVDLQIVNDSIYLIDSNHNKIKTLKYNGSTFYVNHTMGSSHENFSYSDPQGIFVSDKIFVADSSNSRILIYNLDYTFNASILGLSRPSDIIKRQNNIYVTDSIGRSVKIYSLNGTLYSYNTSLVNFGDVYPINASIDIGNDQSRTLFNRVVNVEWKQGAALKTSRIIGNVSIVQSLNNYISSCVKTTDRYSNSLCNVPISFNITSAGDIQINSIIINYTIDHNLPTLIDSINDFTRKNTDTKIPFEIGSSNGVLTVTNISLKYLQNSKNTSFVEQPQDDIWNGTITELTQGGEYIGVIYSADESGILSNKVKYINNYNLITLNTGVIEGEDKINLSMTLIHPDSADGLFASQANNTRNVSVLIYNRTYNINLSLDVQMPDISLDTYSNYLIVFQNASFQTTQDNVTNNTVVDSPYSVRSFSLLNIIPPNISITPQHFNSLAYAGISINNSLASYQSIIIRLNYENMLSYLSTQNYTTLEDNLYIFRCPYYNITSCGSEDWTIFANGTRDKVANTIEILTDSTSSYIIAETNSSLYPTPEESEEDDVAQDDSSDSSSSSSSGGGTSGGALSLADEVSKFCGDGICSEDIGENETSCPIDCSGPQVILYDMCGNNICDLGENPTNCQADCGDFPLDIDAESVENIVIYSGQTINKTLLLKNIINNTVDVELSISGEKIQKFLTIFEEKFTLIKNNNHQSNIIVNIPDEEKPATYNGYLMIKADGRQKNIPILLSITPKPINLYDIEVKVRTDKVSLNGEHLVFDVQIKNPQPEQGVLNMFYSITPVSKSGITGDFILGNETLIFTGQKSLVKEFMLNLTDPNNIIALNNLTRGKYILKVGIVGTDYFGVTTFEVTKPFWTKQKINFALFDLILLLIGLLIYVGYRVIHSRILKNKRYITPVYNLLPKKSSKGFWLGLLAEAKKKAWYDSSDLTTHVLTAGSTGAGKSVSASVFVEEALMKKIPVVVFDPTSQWTGFLKPCQDEKLLRYYSKFGLDPKNDPRSFKGLIYNVKNPNLNLDFDKLMTPGEITVFNLAYLKTGEYDVAVKNIIQTMFGVQWDESPDLKLVVVFDEVHRLLDKYGGHGGYVALEKACREFRKWGIGVIMASQVNADFKEAVQGNILTEVQLNTKSLEDINKISEKYGIEYSNRVTRQGIGVAMIQNAKYNRGKPWFVQFRPTLHSPHKISEKELKLYTSYSDIIDKYEVRIAKIKSLGRDVTDLELEFHLAKNKLKEGHFRMVNIYLESLKNSIKKASRRK